VARHKRLVVHRSCKPLWNDLIFVDARSGFVAAFGA
jgi:hypothetical protein